MWFQTILLEEKNLHANKVHSCLSNTFSVIVPANLKLMDLCKHHVLIYGYKLKVLVVIVRHSRFLFENRTTFSKVAVLELVVHTLRYKKYLLPFFLLFPVNNIFLTLFYKSMVVKNEIEISIFFLDQSQNKRSNIKLLR